jgi:hypothetical protein
MERDINVAIEALKALLEWLRTGLTTGFRPSGGQTPVPVPVDRPDQRAKKGSRRARGSALAEFGPALFFLFIFAVFPVVDIIGLCFGYLSCVTMNDLQLREAAKLPKSVATLQTGSVQQIIPQKYMATVMGAFSGLTELPVTTVTYTLGKTAVYVTVSTTVTVRPFLTIPFFVKVPGLGEPASFTISNNRILENPRYAVQ